MIEPQEQGELKLRDYLALLRRRRGIVVLATVVVVAATLLASLLQTPVYQGNAEILLQERTTESLFDPTTGQQRDPARAVETQIRVLKSKPVEAAVRQRLGSAPSISAHAVGQTDVIAVSAESTSPRQAALTANAYAEAYIDFRRKQAVEDVLAAGKEVQAKITDLQRQIDDMNGRVTAAPPFQRQAVEDAIAGTRQTLLTQQALFKQKLDQLQVDAALKTGGAQLVTPAAVPDTPIKPQPVRNAILALVVGLMFGIGLAFLRDYLDDTVKNKEDVERVAAGLPTLGLIPAITTWKDREFPLVVSRTDSKSPAAEAYRTLRTSIQFMGLDRPMGTLQVTSASAAEGKSTTIANLAVALAQAGLEVVIVDCDLRRPRIHEFFGLTNTVGFTSALLGNVPAPAALQEITGIERLRLMASGPVPPNPSELLSSRRTVEVLTTLQAEADVVLIDSPPVLPVTDAAVLSSRVDATLLVVTAGVTTRKGLQRALEVLTQVDAPVVGIVLNGVTTEGSYGYGYGSSYYAQDDLTPKSKRQQASAT